MSKKIAVFADIDNVKTTFGAFETTLDKVSSFGEIVSCKMYGYRPTKHTEYASLVNRLCFEAVAPIVVKGKRNKTDLRLVTDAVKYAATTPNVDAILIMAEGYILPLVSALRAMGKDVYVAVTSDIDNLTDLAEVYLLPLVAPVTAPKRVVASQDE